MKTVVFLIIIALFMTGGTGGTSMRGTVRPPDFIETGEGVIVHDPAIEIEVARYREEHPSAALIYTDEKVIKDVRKGMLLYEGPAKEISLIHDELNRIGDRSYICIMPKDWKEQLGIFLEPTQDLEHTYEFERNDSSDIDFDEFSIPIGLGGDVLEQVAIFGSLLALFGEPDYLSENLENMYQYSLLAKRSDGKETILLVYSGPTGPSVSCRKKESDMKAGAAYALRELLQETPPMDYSYEGYYYDGPTTLEFGVKDGVPYFQEKELE